ncbi:MAG: hypothetical protein ACRD1I_00455 [Terriglobia bacterium]
MIKQWTTTTLPAWRIGLWAAVIFTCVALPLQASPRKHPPVTNLTIVVTDAKNHKPVFQARLTLSFRDPDSRLGSTISYNAKTSVQGKYTFSFIPMEPIVLVVTAPNHQSFGQKFDVTQANQIIKVQLNPPQPLR